MRSILYSEIENIDMYLMSTIQILCSLFSEFSNFRIQVVKAFVMYGCSFMLDVFPLPSMVTHISQDPHPRDIPSPYYLGGFKLNRG